MTVLLAKRRTRKTIPEEETMQPLTKTEILRMVRKVRKMML